MPCQMAVHTTMAMGACALLCSLAYTMHSRAPAHLISEKLGVHLRKHSDYQVFSTSDGALSQLR